VLYGEFVNRLELVASIADKAKVDRPTAERMLGAYIETVTEALRKGDKVAVVGFGSFELADRKAREGINPATREKILIPSTRLPKFKPGKQLKEAVQK
jgi:DNA-binding protein HU-beta